MLNAETTTRSTSKCRSRLTRNAESGNSGELCSTRDGKFSVVYSIHISYSHQCIRIRISNANPKLTFLFHSRPTQVTLPSGFLRNRLHTGPVVRNVRFTAPFGFVSYSIIQVRLDRSADLVSGESAFVLYSQASLTRPLKSGQATGKIRRLRPLPAAHCARARACRDALNIL